MMQDSLKDKLTDEDRSTLESAVQDGLQWLDNNAEAEVTEIKEKQKEVEAVANPIIQRIYQSNNDGSGAAGGMGQQPPGNDEPTVEEMK